MLLPSNIKVKNWGVLTSVLGRKRLDDFSGVFLENLVDKYIRLINLLKAPRPRNNDGTCVKGADGDFLALAQRPAVAVAYTDTITARAHALCRARGSRLVVEVFCITSLIYG